MSRNNETKLFKALAHPSRRLVLQYLRDKDYVKAGDIAKALGIGNSAMSAHLKILTESDLLISRRRGVEIQYRTNFTVLDEVFVKLSELRSPKSDSEEEDSLP